MSRPQLDYVGYINHTGYGAAAKNNLFALHRNGWNLRLTALDDTSCSSRADKDLLRSLQKVRAETDRFHVFHCIPDAQRQVRHTYRSIGYATFETVGPPQEWVRVLNKNHAVICPSSFCKSIFEEAGVKRPIFLLPHVLDVQQFYMVERARGDTFRFLFFGNWKERKGYEELLKAWLAFKPDEPVALHVKVEDRRLLDAAILKVIGRQRHAPIVCESRMLMDDQLPAYFRSFDCLVSPTRGEGFGLPILQSMAVGTPVVATACTGVLDFLSDQTGWPLPVSGYEAVPVMDNIPQFRGRLWPRIDPDALAGLMREVLEKPEEATLRARRAAALVKERFHHGVVGPVFDAIVSAIKS